MERNNTQMNDLMTGFLAEILAKYVDGVASEVETEAVKEYLASSAEARATVAMMKDAAKGVVVPVGAFPIPVPMVAFSGVYSRTGISQGRYGPGLTMGSGGAAEVATRGFVLFEETWEGWQVSLVAYVNANSDHEMCFEMARETVVVSDTCFAVTVLVEGSVRERGTVFVEAGKASGQWVFVPKPRIGDNRQVTVRIEETAIDSGEMVAGSGEEDK
jgi:hypothetical protein